MTLDIRDVPEADLDRALDLSYLAFHLSPGEKRRNRHRELLRRCTRIGVYDGGQLAGLAAAHLLTLSLPGGQLPCAAVDFVSVAPTHRRRGVLSSMMAELWRRCAADGQPLSCLWPSESAIYGRYGYAPATETYRIEIDSARPLALRVAPDERPLRLIDPADAPAVLGPLFDATLADRAGRFTRDEAWWRQEVLNLDGARESGSGSQPPGPPRVVVLGEPGEPPAGYALYRADGNGAGTVTVDELEAESAPAAAALWAYLASIDLTTTVRVQARPADDPLLYIAADRDQVRVTRQEIDLWVRLVDVHAALTARSWAAPVDVVLDLRDTSVPANAGRFRLTVGDGERAGAGAASGATSGAASGAASGATWKPTDDAADISLDVRELGACYLGGTRLRHLVRAGLATEHTPGAVRRLEAALETEWLPFTGENY
ncbi:GNAT family N-acetyltransferase [Streptomyces piniterrae]|uniref:GNAT family N-acetyltransferase n=1 Tax=Streptomyces piniterrae TaxID=2571125 RepID=A0A4U0N7F6_9ACTN|nr:GNAT family N-acetyltransferase [Streptomyces piniterrae]TJZ49483.1 GNAT family N-acetyltransferase [Streptomyces piniterrae]